MWYLTTRCNVQLDFTRGLQAPIFCSIAAVCLLNQAYTRILFLKDMERVYLNDLVRVRQLFVTVVVVHREEEFFEACNKRPSQGCFALTTASSGTGFNHLFNFELCNFSVCRGSRALLCEIVHCNFQRGHNHRWGMYRLICRLPLVDLREHRIVWKDSHDGSTVMEIYGAPLTADMVITFLQDKWRDFTLSIFIIRGAWRNDHCKSSLSWRGRRLNFYFTKQDFRHFHGWYENACGAQFGV